MSFGRGLPVSQVPAVHLPVVSAISVAAIRRPALRTLPEILEHGIHHRNTTLKSPMAKYPTGRPLPD